MNAESLGVDPTSLHAPPSSPGELTKPPSTWPTVLGVIAIVFGSGGALMNTCNGILSPLMSPLMQKFTQLGGQGQNNAMFEAQMHVTRHYMGYTIPLSLASAAVAVVLLVGGMALLKRRGWSAKTLVVWAILRITLAIPASIIGYLLSRDLFDAMKDAPSQPGGASSMPPGLLDFAGNFAVVGIVLGLAWACALPVFMLVWFNRAAIKAQSAAWRADDSPPLPRRGGSST